MAKSRVQYRGEESPLPKVVEQVAVYVIASFPFFYIGAIAILIGGAK